MRKCTSMALALAVAGGVYLSGGTADASNMGFKLERNFAQVVGLRNIYFVSFPLFNGLGDVADETPAAGAAACEFQSPGRPFTGDMIITMGDIACDLATDFDDPRITGGVFAVQRINTATVPCGFQPTSLTKNPVLGFVFGGTLGIQLDPIRDIGFQINVSFSPNTVAVDNRAVIVGSHDPSHLGHTLPAPATCTRDFINVPYHTMYRTPEEILCGLQGSDWNPNGAGNGPDACPNGIFDPVSNVQTTVSTFENVTAGGEKPRGVRFFLGSYLWTGSPYNLAPGESYKVTTNTGYNPRLFRSPHF